MSTTGLGGGNRVNAVGRAAGQQDSKEGTARQGAGSVRGSMITLTSTNLRFPELLEDKCHHLHLDLHTVQSDMALIGMA